jgi:undecaprenyl-diphosphatase
MSLDQGLFVPGVLGVIEGLTEFLPVSSTGHLLLTEHFLGLAGDDWTAFTILIQLGAILAIVVVYFWRRLGILRDALAGKRGAWRFILGIVLAGLPAVIAGALAHDLITKVFYASPLLICSMLIIGGVILLYVDQLKVVPKYTDIYSYPPLLCFYIGLFQMLALIPGVSRSGATIVGSLLLGTDKRSAAEFSFFLAIPIMIGAFGYDFYKNHAAITSSVGLTIAIGFAAAFVVAFFVVRYALDFIQRHGFAPFAYWRIFVGAIGLWGVLLFKPA